MSFRCRLERSQGDDKRSGPDHAGSASALIAVPPRVRGVISECRAMREAQLRDAKANLSAVVDQAARGETTVVTRYGMAPSFPDLTIACIARARGLVVATHNTREFTPMGVEVLNPFEV